MTYPRIEEAITLMNNFADRTGLTSKQPPRRYLWTDAFAVCNYLGLARTTGEHRYTELALQLVEQVHHTLADIGTTIHAQAGSADWVSAMVSYIQPGADYASVKRCRSVVQMNPSTNVWSGIETASISTI